MRTRISNTLVCIAGIVSLSTLAGCGFEVVHEMSGKYPEPNGIELVQKCEGSSEACAARKAYVERTYGVHYREAAAANAAFQAEHGVHVGGHGESHAEGEHEAPAGHDQAGHEGDQVEPAAAPEGAAPVAPAAGE